VSERLVWDFLNHRRVPESEFRKTVEEFNRSFDERHAAPAGPMVISDYVGGSGNVNGLLHPAEGRRTDSKSEFRKWTRAHGCVEIGDQAPPSAPRKSLNRGDRVEAIKRAMGAL
jgi:hypothetical protein